jgi:16S rRNA (cytosine1402-N4)-methyltransferase
MAHVPVLVKEVVEFLDPKSGENFVDCTLGDGGHSALILEKTGPEGKVLGFDLDPEAIKAVTENLKRFQGRFIAANKSYTELASEVAARKFGPVAGLLADLGFSSPQLDDRNRGLTFMRDEPLDMRYSGEGTSAAEIVNSWTRDELAKVIADYGEERFASRIAEAIVRARKEKKLLSTLQLAAIVKTAVPPNYEGHRINPATRTFQALRIAVNDELGSVAKLLPQALEAVEIGGRIAIISFHSLEDRIVKNFFKEQSAAGQIRILTNKPVVAGEDETKNNPRSRSAKLRVAIKTK